MSSGYIRLAARSEQDMWFTGEPKQTYFLAIYKKRDPYVLESYEIPFDTANIPYGTTATCTIPAKGNMIRTITLKCTLPALFYQKTGWCYPVSSTYFQPFIYLFDSSNNIIETLQVRSNLPFYSAALRTWFPYSLNLTSVSYDGTRFTYNFNVTNVARVGFLSTDASFFGFDPNLGTKFGLSGVVTYAVTAATAAPFTLQQSGWVGGFVPPSGLGYIDSVGTYIIKTAELLVGGQTIDVVTGEYIDIRQDLEVPYENQQALLLLNGKGDTSTIQIPRTYYITLPFVPEMNIPIRKLYRHDVKVNVSFEQFSRLTTTDVPLAGYGFSNAASSTIITVQNPTLFSNTACYDGSNVYIFSYNTFCLFNPRASASLTSFINVGDTSINSIVEASFVINGRVFAVTTDQYIVGFPVINNDTFSSFLTTSYIVFPTGLTRRAACSDGRYIYAYAGVNDATQAKNTVYKFDTQALSVETYTIGTNINFQTTPAFDGRYVYFTDKYQNTVIYRYDTTGSFSSAGSWTTFNYGSVPLSIAQQNFIATVFDGRYMYWITDTQVGSNAVTWLRYDTTLAFAAAAFTSFVITGVTGVTAGMIFRSPVFDGQYIYVSSGSIFLRYNTLASFTAASSYDWFNYVTGATSAGPTTAIQIGGTNTFNVNLFDGRYIFSFPLGTSNVLRQDTSTVISSPVLQSSIIVEYVSTPGNDVKPEEYVVSQTSLTQSVDPRFSLEIQAPVKEAFVANQTPASASGPYAYNSLGTVELRFNDEKAFDWTTRTITPFLFHSTMPQRNVQLISFSQDPESNKRIAGSVNFARMRDIQMTVPQASATFTRVYARTYNVFQVENGLGGLKFMSPSFKTMYQPNNRWFYTANAASTISTTLPLSGNVLAGTQIGGIGASTGTTSPVTSATQTTPTQKIVTDTNGNFHIALVYQGNPIQFGQGGYLPSYGGTPDSIVTMYSSAGTFVQLGIITGFAGVTSYITGIASQGTSLYICGYYSGGAIAIYDSYGGYIALPAPASGASNMFVARFSITNLGYFILWATYGGSATASTTCVAQAISADSEGCYVTGNFTSATTVTFYDTIVPQTNKTLTATVGTRDGFLVKFLPSGTPSWTARMAVASSTVNATGIASSTDAGVVVTGSWSGATALSVYNSAGSTTAIGGSTNSNDAFIAKYTTAGGVTWVTRIGAGGRGQVAVTVGLDLSISVTGSMQSTGTSWIAYNQPGIAGTVTAGPITNACAYLAKYNWAGTAQWISLITTSNASSPNHGLGITVDAFANVFVTGLMTNQTTIGTKTYTVAGQDGYVAKYDSSGAFVWSSQIAQTVSDTKTFGGSVFYDRRSGSVWSIGSFAGTTLFNNYSGSGGVGFIVRGTYDTFIIKYSA